MSLGLQRTHIGGRLEKKRYAGITRRASQHAFEQLQIVEQVFDYLLKPGVNEKLVATYDDVKGFLKEFEALYRKQYPKTPALDLDRLWTTFMRDLTTKMKVWTKRWLLYRADEMAKDWAAAAILSYAQEALTILEKAQEHQKKHGIAVDKFKPDVVFK